MARLKTSGASIDYVRVNDQPYVVGESAERYGVQTQRTGPAWYIREYYGVFAAAVPGRLYQRSMEIAAKATRLELILHLAVTTGMRQMELLGLKWGDLDWTKHTIKVECQLVRPEEGRIQFASPKTKFGRRTVSLGSRAIEVLRGHYERKHVERRAAGDLWTETDLIFTNATGGPLDPRNLVRDFKKLLQDAGLPMIRFHDLRHTAASLMLNHGIPVLVVSRMLGHSRPSITLDVYGHLIPSAQAEVAEKMDELISPIELTSCTGLYPVAPDFHQQPDAQDTYPHL